MSRLTEYHCGVAVIKDKNRLSEVMAKLARFEDLEDELFKIYGESDGLLEKVVGGIKDFAAKANKRIILLTDEDADEWVRRKNPETNGDRIRVMTDEELTKIIQCPYDTAGKSEDIMPCVLDEDAPDLVPYEECQKCILNWLRKEVAADD